MDKILLVDVGNNSVKWSLTVSTDCIDMLQQQYPKELTKEFFVEIWSDITTPHKIIVTCVAATDVWLSLEEACRMLWDLKAERIIATKIGYGLTNAYLMPMELGSDRWCAMIGAYQDTDFAFIVIDAGSALTIDVVKEKGHHVGGYILPGIEMMRKSLNQHTAQLKKDSKQDFKPSLLPESTTSTCIEAGIYLSTVKLIEAVYKKESKKLNSLQCYLTGGDADFIVDLLSFECIVMPDLVLQGLANIAQIQDQAEE